MALSRRLPGRESRLDFSQHARLFEHFAGAPNNASQGVFRYVDRKARLLLDAAVEAAQ